MVIPEPENMTRRFMQFLPTKPEYRQIFLLLDLSGGIFEKGLVYV